MILGGPLFGRRHPTLPSDSGILLLDVVVIRKQHVRQYRVPQVHFHNVTKLSLKGREYVFQLSFKELQIEYISTNTRTVCYC